MEKDGYHLRKGTVLKQRYLVDSVIGQGGFGITYLGKDLQLDIAVAIKEYFPVGIALRESADSNKVEFSEDRDTAYYQEGIKKFLTEARTLARFYSEEGIVNVLDTFEENDTAYIIMEHLEGISLGEYIEKNGPLDFEYAYEMLMPVLHTLKSIHETGLIHRDISPDNIFVLKSGKLKLLDFGAARDVSNEDQKTLSILLKPGYAPEEQYRGKGQQGPWTDIYALCATLYKCITKVTPDDAVQRVLADTLVLPIELGADISKEAEVVLMQGMAVRKEDRIQDIDILLFRFGDVLKQETPIPSMEKQTTVRKKEPRTEQSRKVSRIILKSVVFIVLFLTGVILLYQRVGNTNPYRSRDGVTTVVSGQELTAKDGKLISRDKKTEVVELENCVIGDDVIELLANMNEVRKITLENCSGFTSLAPLLNISSLETLHLKSQEKSSFAGEKMFGKEVSDLNELVLQNVEFQTGADFMNIFPGLSTLWITDSEGLNSADFLGNIPVVANLILDNTKFSDLSAVNQLKNLTVFSAMGCDIGEISFLADSSGLKVLRLDANRIADIMPLKECKELEVLSLGNNQISDLAACLEMIKLRAIHVPDNQISSLEGISNSTALNIVSVYGNDLSDLSVLTKSKEYLEQLDFADNKVSDISFLKECHNLQRLIGDNNQVSDISVLEEKQSLEVLSLRNNEIKSIGALQNLNEIEYLDLGENEITSISALNSTGSDYLTLYLDHNQISDMAGLPLNRYRALTLHGNQFIALDTASLKAINVYSNGSLNLEGMMSLDYQEGSDFTVFSTHMGSLYLLDVPMDQRYELHGEEYNSDTWSINQRKDEPAESTENEVAEDGGYSRSTFFITTEDMNQIIKERKDVELSYYRQYPIL